MKRFSKLLLLALLVALAVILAPAELTPTAEACIPFYCCVDQCDDAWEACMAACPPETPMCELACNNQWWDCNAACGGF